jgi:hypothetical protein
MAEGKRKDTYSVDEARMKAGVNQETEWFIAKIERAASDGKHRVRLTDAYCYSTEEQAALYELERMGFRVEFVKRHRDSELNAEIQDSFYAFW